MSRSPDPAAQMQISVLVPTIGRPTDLRSCLFSLVAQSRPPDEVVVVLPSMASRCDEVVEEFAGSLRTATVRGSERGIVAAVNLGLTLVRGAIVCLIDDDATAPPDWLERIEGWFTDPVVGAVGGPNLRPGQTLRDLPVVSRWDRFRWFGYGDVRTDRRTKRPQDAHFLVENNLAWRRWLVPAIDERLVGRDERFGDDITLSLLNRGYRVIADPSVYVWHRHVRFDRPTLPDAVNAYSTAHNQTYLWLKHLPAWRRPLFLAFGLLVGDRSVKGAGTFAAWALKNAPRPSRARAILALVWPTLRGRLAGIRTFRAARGLSKPRSRRSDAMRRTSSR